MKLPTVAEHFTESPFSGDPDEPVYSIAEPAAIVAVLESLDVGAHVVLENTGLSQANLLDPKVLVSTRQRLQIYNNAQRVTPDPAFALAAGSRLHLSSYGILGFAMMSSSTLASGIELAFKYLKLAGPLLQKSFRVEGHQAVIEAADTMRLGPLLPVATEIWLASVWVMIQDALAEGSSLTAVELAFPDPGYAQSYRECFGCKVRFGAPISRIYFDAEALSLPLTQSSEITLNLCRPICEQLLAGIERKSGLSQKVQQWLLPRSAVVPKLHDAAQALHLSPRTLRRRLNAEGTSFRDIHRQVRLRIAAEYLRDTGLTIEEIAERIGYSDSANFRSAFKRWTSMSPAAFRKDSDQRGPGRGFDVFI